MHLIVNHYSPEWFWLTIHSSKATKDQGIAELLQSYNFSRENLTVFGDNTNDIKMFKYAKNAIAVENACQELKDVADTVIETNSTDSVVKYIAKENGVELI